MSFPGGRYMSIELTTEQAHAVCVEGESLVMIDPQTKQAYRLVREEVFQKLQSRLFDDSPWTPQETAILAGIAFGKLDDADYSDYLLDKP